jgi:hypothetical protein
MAYLLSLDAAINMNPVHLGSEVESLLLLQPDRDRAQEGVG